MPRQRGGTWQARLMVGAVRYEEGGFRTKKEAKDREAEIRQGYAPRGLHRRGPDSFHMRGSGQVAGLRRG